jgi:hypothetical protein
MSALRDFRSDYLGPLYSAVPGQQSTGAGDKPDQTDDTGLVAAGVISISPDGGNTDEPDPQPDVEYDFCAKFADAGKLPSGPFSVVFELSGDLSWKMSFRQESGLKPGASVLAVVHFGKFPNQFGVYHLTACIEADSAPDAPICCAGPYDFKVNTADQSQTQTDDQSQDQTNDQSQSETVDQAQDVSQDPSASSQAQTNDQSQPQTDDQSQTQSDDQSQNQTDDQSQTQSDDQSQTPTDDQSQTHSGDQSQNQTDDQEQNQGDNQPQSHTDDHSQSQTDDQEQNQGDNQPQSHTDNHSQTQGGDQTETQTDDQEQNQTDDDAQNQCHDLNYIPATQDASQASDDNGARCQPDIPDTPSPQLPPEDSEQQECVETIIYVQKGLNPDLEELNGHMVGEVVLDVTDAGMWGVKFCKIAVQAAKTTLGAAVRHAAAGIGAEVLVTAGLILIMAETFPEETIPRSLGCPEQCPYCPQMSAAKGPGAQCLNAPGHCGQHQCQNNHTWVTDGDPAQTNGSQSNGDAGTSAPPPNTPDSGDGNGGFTPAPGGQSDDPDQGRTCQAPPEGSGGSTPGAADQSSDSDHGVVPGAGDASVRDATVNSGNVGGDDGDGGGRPDASVPPPGETDQGGSCQTPADDSGTSTPAPAAQSNDADQGGS